MIRKVFPKIDCVIRSILLIFLITTSNGMYANKNNGMSSANGVISIYGHHGLESNNFQVYLQNPTSCTAIAIKDVVYLRDHRCVPEPANPIRHFLIDYTSFTAESSIYIKCNETSRWLNDQLNEGQSECYEYIAAGLPVSIPDSNLTGVTSTVNVSNIGSITSVKVKNLRGTHSWVGDLSFTLISPNETSLLLIDQMCDNLDNLDITLSDAAASDIECPIDDAATEKPQNPFSVFNGESAAGIWKLVVVDNAGNDIGTLDGWTLEICTDSGADCPDNSLIDNIIESGTYQAGIQLSARGSVPAISDVLFRAGNNVELMPNFNVAANAGYEVRIGGCQ